MNNVLRTRNWMLALVLVISVFMFTPLIMAPDASPSFSTNISETVYFEDGKFLTVDGIINSTLEDRTFTIQVYPEAFPDDITEEKLECSAYCYFNVELKSRIILGYYFVNITTGNESVIERVNVELYGSQFEFLSVPLGYEGPPLGYNVDPREIQEEQRATFRQRIKRLNEDIRGGIKQKRRAEKSKEVINLEKRIETSDIVIEKKRNGKSRVRLAKQRNRFIFEDATPEEIKSIRVLRKNQQRFVSDIVDVKASGFGSTQVILRKEGEVRSILKCDSFVGSNCRSGWYDTGLPFDGNETYVWFNVTEFSAYVASGPGYTFAVNITSPLTDVSVVQNTSQRVDVNLSCSGGNCGNINLSLNYYYPRSCKEIKDIMNDSPSGVYTIDNDGIDGANASVEVYCDMEFDGGGWTLLFQRRSDGTNTQSCGTNLNTFLYDTCGDVDDLGYTDSYSFDLDNTLPHDQYLVVQYSSNLSPDLDDAYIVNTSNNIFASTTTTVNTPVSAICDINASNCDSTSTFMRYRGSNGYMFRCDFNTTSGLYQGHFGSCPNGFNTASLSAQFGNRNQWAETKLWGFAGGSDVYMERVFTREDVNYRLQELNISNVTTDTPVSVNSSNPTNITLNAGQSQLITFYVNATGTIGNSFEIYASAFKDNDSTIRAQSDNFTMSISDDTLPEGNKTLPLNDSTITTKNVTFSVNVSDSGGLKSATIYVWNASGSLLFTEATTLTGTFNQTTWTNTFSQNGNMTWNVLVTDAGDNTNFADNNTNWTFELTFPSYNIVLYNTSTNISATQDQFFNFSVNVSCLGGNCSQTNVSLNLDYPVSCKEIKDIDNSSSDGVYIIDPDGIAGAGTPVSVYCDMTTNGGGWTLLFQRRSDGTNTQACGTNLNSFLRATCGSVNNLGYTDSYSYDLDNTLNHSQYLVIQYDSGLVADTDDAYIINTTGDAFPDTTAVVATAVDALCDINGENCDSTGAVLRYRGGGGYMSSCTGQVASGSFHGHFGACPDGTNSDPLSSQFGGRSQYAETKLWGFAGGSDIFMERVFTRENTTYDERVISIVSGTTPFWVNTANEQTISIPSQSSTIVSWLVNATGAVGTSYHVYASVQALSDLSIRNVTSDVNVTISDSTPPIVNKTYPINGTIFNSTQLQFNATSSDDSGMNSVVLYIWNETGGLVYNESISLGGNLSANTTWFVNITDNGTYYWNVEGFDVGLNSAFADSNTNFTFYVNLPIVTVTLLNPTTDQLVLQNETVALRYNISCENRNCGDLNITFRIPDWYVSCKEVLDAGESTGDGIYTIDVDGPHGSGAPTRVYCDMTTNEGGWTLLFQRRSQTTNTQACGTNFNSFLRATCGDVDNLDYDDSYSYDLDNTLNHSQYLVVQYDSALNPDSDDAYIINTTGDPFPDSTAVVATAVDALCDINGTNCDSTGAVLRYRGGGGYMSSCTGQVASGSFNGHFGACPDGTNGDPLSSQFGDRSQYAETKLWGFGGGSENFGERVSTREDTLYSGDRGIIGNTTGVTPFRVNASNPLVQNFDAGDYLVITWYVNATGPDAFSSEVFTHAILVNDSNLFDESTRINISITNHSDIDINKTYPLNGSIINDSVTVTFNATANNTVGMTNISIYIWNSTEDLHYNNTVNLSDNTSVNMTWYSSFIVPDNYTWNVLAYDEYGNFQWANDNTNFTFNWNLSKQFNETNTSVSKVIVSNGASDQYTVRINVTNDINNVTNTTLFDFVHTDFVYGSFNVLYDFNYTINGTTELNGTILGWNLTLNPFTSTEINYSIIGTGDYMLRRNHVFGVEDR